MKLKKISLFVIILILGYLSIQITPNISNDDTDCPEYINEFVIKNQLSK